MLSIELRPIDSVRPYPQNPRKNDAAVEHVARSIQAYGWRQPVVVDKDGVIVAGHTRWKAAQSLGLTEIPVHVAADLSPEQARAYRLADNRSAEIAEWDSELLPVELAELKELDIDQSTLGWSAEELSEIMAPAGNAGIVDEDDVPEPPDAAVTRPGDVWVLGRHRLLCGDSSNPADVDRLLNGAQIHLVNTDPPLQRSRRAEKQQRDRGGPVVLRALRVHAPPEVRCRAPPGEGKGNDAQAPGQGPTAGQ